MTLFRRELYLQRLRGFYAACDLIKVITGVRRCGKTCLMRTIGDELLEKGVCAENLLFLDLESKDFHSIRSGDALDRLIERKTRTSGTKYVFIDGLRNVTGWEDVLNSWLNHDVSFFVTGTNAEVLSGERITKLTGRYIEFPLLPLSFSEYLAFRTFYGKQPAADPEDDFADYLCGAFPETALSEDPLEKHRYGQTVLETVFAKDVRTYARIKNRTVFNRVRDYVLSQSGRMPSLESITRYFDTEEHVSIKIDMVKRYLQLLEDAKILCRCDQFDVKKGRTLTGDRKYYAADLSFCSSRNTALHDKARLENAIYLYACSLGCDVNTCRIGRNTGSDFIVRDIHGQTAYLQVACTLRTEEDLIKEFRLLLTMRDNWPKYLLSLDRLLNPRLGIHHENLIRFMAAGKTFV